MAMSKIWSSNPINVVTAADDGYVPHVAAMLHSLFENNPRDAFSIHFLHRRGIDDELRARLAKLCEASGAEFHHVEVERELLAGLPIDGRYPEEAWYRVILPRLLPGLHRALWLDADVIVMQPIRELWEIDLAGYPLAACPNALLYDYAAGIAMMGITDRTRYFNTGVLLLNLDQMREEKSEDALRFIAQQNRKWIKFADQDVLNCAYHLRYCRLHLSWNVLTHSYFNTPETIRVHGKEEVKSSLRSPKILHFTGAAEIKPWSYKCGHPYRDAYLRHRAAAGWAPPQYTDKNFRSLIVRQLPMRLRVVLSTLVNGRYAEMLSYIKRW